MHKMIFDRTEKEVGKVMKALEKNHCMEKRAIVLLIRAL